MDDELFANSISFGWLDIGIIGLRNSLTCLGRIVQARVAMSPVLAPRSWAACPPWRHTVLHKWPQHHENNQTTGTKRSIYIFQTNITQDSRPSEPALSPLRQVSLSLSGTGRPSDHRALLYDRRDQSRPKEKSDSCPPEYHPTKGAQDVRARPSLDGGALALGSKSLLAGLVGPREVDDRDGEERVAREVCVSGGTISASEPSERQSGTHVLSWIPAKALYQAKKAASMPKVPPAVRRPAWADVASMLPA